MRTWHALLAAVTLAGCAQATSGELGRRADEHMARSYELAAAGDDRGARTEQRTAERLYQKAGARALTEGQPAPPPPSREPLYPYVP